jgi:hypothetical protein
VQHGRQRHVHRIDVVVFQQRVVSLDRHAPEPFGEVGRPVLVPACDGRERDAGFVLHRRQSSPPRDVGASDHPDADRLAVPHVLHRHSLGEVSVGELPPGEGIT